MFKVIFGKGYNEIHHHFGGNSLFLSDVFLDTMFCHFRSATVWEAMLLFKSSKLSNDGFA